jgi:two-component system LytT family response regulator
MVAKIIKSYCNDVEIIAEASGVEEGYHRILDMKPDLVLLDIKMDDGSGFDLLEKFEKIDFKIIFITAFQEYALQAIKFSALDYIVKPVDPEELIAAVNNAKTQLSIANETQLALLKEGLSNKDTNDRKILLKTAESIHLVMLSNVYYCEADGGYTCFYTDGGQKVLVSKPLSEYEALFREYGFFRVHKSFLVNLHKVERFDKEDGGYLVLTDEMKVPVASRKREQLINLLGKLTE